jgi:hypothetical protein
MEEEQMVKVGLSGRRFSIITREHRFSIASREHRLYIATEVTENIY